MKMKTQFKLILSLCAILTIVTAGAQEPLDRYLLIAAEHNPGLKSRFDEYMAALEMAPQAGALPDPQLAFGYFISRAGSGMGAQQAKISAAQMFPWFGTLAVREDAATRAAKARYETFQEARSALFHQVRENYFNLYYNEKAIRIVRENLDILHTFRDLAMVKVEAGMVSAVDAYRIEMEIGDLENHLALLKDQQVVLEVSFMNLLNVEETPLIIPDTLWDNDPIYSREVLLDSIRSGNHQLLGLELQREAMSLKQEVARKSGKPEFAIGIEYMFMGEGAGNPTGKDAIVFPGIGITIPLYREKYRAMVREAVYMESALENEKLDQGNMIETLFEEAWKEMKDAERRKGLYAGQQQLAKMSVELLETEYATAGKDFEEILRMEQKLLLYSLELEKARADKQAALSFIEYLSGN